MSAEVIPISTHPSYRRLLSVHEIAQRLRASRQRRDELFKRHHVNDEDGA